VPIEPVRHAGRTAGCRDTMMTTALIADDEPLMLQRIRESLQASWPDLRIVAEAKNGFEAITEYEAHRPDIVFLDIRMPGKTGLEVAATIGDAAHIIFVTAYDEYAIRAFENGAADYLLKPVDVARLAQTIERLQKRMTTKPPIKPADLTQLVQSLLEKAKPQNKLKWIRASLGQTMRLINVDDVAFFQSDTKYTRIVLRTGEAEALVRTPLKELLDGLDGDLFWQVHRGTVINIAEIDRAVREGPEKLVLYLKSSKETLTVSRQYFHLFKQI
jgi:DNA-binding LytR/AlgR family response regulator